MQAFLVVLYYCRRSAYWRSNGTKQKLLRYRARKTRWFVSRVLYFASKAMTIHLRLRLPAISSNQPECNVKDINTLLFGFASGEVYLAMFVTKHAVRSYRTFSAFPRMRGSLFSVALSLGLPPVGITHHLLS